MTKPTGNTVTFAVASAQQTVPGQEQRLNPFTKPINRFERRCKDKASKKLLMRKSASY